MINVPVLYKLDTTLASDHRLFAGGQWVNDTRTKCRGCGALDDSSEPAVIQIALSHLGRMGFVEQLWNSHLLPIIREDLVDRWLSNGFTGFNTKPVSFIDWFTGRQRILPRSIPNYFRLVTTSKVKLAEPKPKSAPCETCGFVDHDFPKVGVHLDNGIQVDASSWDGADFCGVRGYEFAFFGRRAAELTLLAGFNVKIAFIRPENWGQWNEFDNRRWTAKGYREYIGKFLICQAADLQRRSD